MRSPVLTVEGVLVNGDVINRRRPHSNRIESFYPSSILPRTRRRVSIFSLFLFFLLPPPPLSLLFLSSILEITNAVKSEVEINLG